ncbi:hypothetical protein NDU88_001618 [Pleurodeles waltl]|uniref:Reverse transcriptase n=1 Tax=Pleurodeles waltl TaxID=8319 RepID=A0AAV7LA00_PLEWA|nr:hypothetical protein NDU88_001618 [Pleurodeles waltl]
MRAAPSPRRGWCPDPRSLSEARALLGARAERAAESRAPPRSTLTRHVYRDPHEGRIQWGRVAGFLSSLQLSRLLPEQAVALDGPIDVEEIRLALSQMSRNRAPGSDRLPVEYFASLAPHLLQPMLWVFNGAQTRGQLPA